MTPFVVPMMPARSLSMNPVLMLLSLHVLCPLPAAETTDAKTKAESILRAAREAAVKCDSFTSKFHTESNFGPGKLDSYGTMAYLKPGYFKIITTTKDPVAGEVNTLMVTNSKVTYTETRGNPTEPPIVVKSISAPSSAETSDGSGGMSGSPLQTLEQLQSLFDFELDPAASGESLRQMEMDVLTGKFRKESAKSPGDESENTNPQPDQSPRAPSPDNAFLDRMMGSARIWIGRHDRLLHRIEISPPVQPPEKPDSNQPTIRPAAAPRITTTFLDLKMNAPLAPTDFIYTPPPGVRVVDLGAPPAASP